MRERAMAWISGRSLAISVVFALVAAAPSMATVSEREHRSTLTVRLLGLPDITMKAQPGSKLTVNSEEKSIAVPKSVFKYTGTLVPDYENIPYTAGGRGTNLDTRLIQSVQVAVRNQSGTLRPSAHRLHLTKPQFGGDMPLTGEFRLKFKPYIRKQGGILVTQTLDDLVLPGWAFGQTRGFEEVDAGNPPENAGMRIWYLGEKWRTGVATTFLGSVTASQLPTKTFDGEGIGVPEDYYQNPFNDHLQWNRDGGKQGSKMVWTQGDTDGYGTVKAVAPIAIHQLEQHHQLKANRYYTLLSWSQIEIEVLPKEVGVAYSPKMQRGLPSLAGAVCLTAFGLVKRRRRAQTS